MIPGAVLLGILGASPFSHHDSALWLVDVVDAESIVASAHLGRIAVARVSAAVLVFTVFDVVVAAPALHIPRIQRIQIEPPWAWGW